MLHFGNKEGKPCTKPYIPCAFELWKTRHGLQAQDVGLYSSQRVPPALQLLKVRPGFADQLLTGSYPVHIFGAQTGLCRFQWVR